LRNNSLDLVFNRSWFAQDFLGVLDCIRHLLYSDPSFVRRLMLSSSLGVSIYLEQGVVEYSDQGHGA